MLPRLATQPLVFRHTKLMALVCLISDCPTYAWSEVREKAFFAIFVRYHLKSALASVLNRRLRVGCKAVFTVRNLFSIDNCSKLVTVSYLRTTSAHEPPPRASLVIRTWRHLPLPLPTTPTSASCLRVFSVWFLSSSETKGWSVCVPIYLDALGSFSAQCSAVGNLV